MPNDAEDRNLIIEIDKKLGILINDVNREMKSNDEFKVEIKKTIDSTQTRLREIEIWKSKTEVAQEDNKFIKQTIIRWVVANMLTSIATVAGMIYLFTKGL